MPLIETSGNLDEKENDNYNNDYENNYENDYENDYDNVNGYDDRLDE